MVRKKGKEAMAQIAPKDDFKSNGKRPKAKADVVVEPPFDATIGGGNDKGGGNDGGGDGEDGGGGGVPGTGGGTNQTNTPTPDRPECSDGIDNDNDGAIDYGLDWGCTNHNDDSEDTVPQPP